MKNGDLTINHFLLLLSVLYVLTPHAWAAKSFAGGEWPEAVKTIRYVSPADGSLQRAMFYAPATTGPKPLLVALHSWGGDYAEVNNAPYARWCIEHEWVLIHPDTRGPHNRPESTGSELVIKDILGAVEYARKNAHIDSSRTYMVGASGGGFTSLLMAGRTPRLWAGVSAWVPISDLNTWYSETKVRADLYQYAEEIVASCGGVPEKNSKAERECRKRSPLTYLAGASKVSVDINAGIRDGHDGPVYTSHALRAFNALAARRDRLKKSDIAYIVKEAKIPPRLRSEVIRPAYGKKRILFRRSSRKVRVTLFDGGHEIDFESALRWLSGQRRGGATIAQ